MRVPRKLKKEKNKIEVRFHIHTKEREVVILPNSKVNKWTLKFVSRLKYEIKKNDEMIWKDMCDKFLNPNKINKKVSFNI